MRRPRSSRDAALLGVLSGLNPFGRTGHPVLDAAYLAAVGALLGMCLSFVGCQPASAGGVFPTPSTFEPAMDSSLLSYGFLTALARVESGMNDAAVNEAEGAVGRFQIRQCYLDDANEAAGTRYALAEMADPRKAMQVVCAYLGRYAPAFEARAGRPATAEDLARIHNGGPRGAEKDATLDYARRFRKAYSGVAWYTDCPRFEVAAR